ncbi:MAG: molybdenum cofactor guanylyltransferase [Actinomycetota bacterium]|jgi:molybdopterin-guanine dinucleotide biosynthesis protein A|nr:molybdenum cofactor guanylyltransferase [Actinomycetota bacterium]MDA8279963.1 molybdenum cofactor guanylyltransferase [Actinomycetota bacterium]
MVLTGGRSRRMGFDKASMIVGDRRLAERVVASLVAGVGGPVVEVGPGLSGCTHVTREVPEGGGPLAATVAGATMLAELGHRGAVVVLACDLPLVHPAVVRLLASHPGTGSVVPVVDGHAQPLCARWSAVDLVAGRDALDRGERSMRPLLDQPGVVLLDEAAWRSIADADAFADADTPADLDRLGLVWRMGP